MAEFWTIFEFQITHQTTCSPMLGKVFGPNLSSFGPTFTLPIGLKNPIFPKKAKIQIVVVVREFIPNSLFTLQILIVLINGLQGKGGKSNLKRELSKGPLKAAPQWANFGFALY